MTCHYEYRVPRCQHIKTNGTQCGSPALKNCEYCYFHYRWRMTHVDLSQSAHHVTSMFDLPVLEDADSIQITLGQIMRMIVCRQVDTKSAGLLLYGLQIASANLRRTRFEPYHKDVTVDLFRVPERIIGDEAWSPSDFKDANVGRASPPAKESCVVATLPEPQPAEPPSPAKEQCVGRAPSPAKETQVARTPSSAKESSPEKQSDVGRASPLASVPRTLLSAKEPAPTKETHVAPASSPAMPSSANQSSPQKQSDGGRASSPANAPSSAKKSCPAPTPPEPQPKAPLPATQPAPASNVSSSSLPSATQQRELQQVVRAIPRALKGDWRDLKTLFEFAGIYPPKDDALPTDS